MYTMISDMIRYDRLFGFLQGNNCGEREHSKATKDRGGGEQFFRVLRSYYWKRLVCFVGGCALPCTSF